MRREGPFASNGMAEPREAKMALTNDGRGCRICAGDSNRALLKEKVMLAQF